MCLTEPFPAVRIGTFRVVSTLLPVSRVKATPIAQPQQESDMPGRKFHEMVERRKAL